MILSSGGAAERAGVPPGARLLELNGVSVEKLTQRQINKKVGPKTASTLRLVTELPPAAASPVPTPSPTHTHTPSALKSACTPVSDLMPS